MPKKPFNHNLENIPPSGIRAFFDMVLERQDILSLGVGEPDFETPKHISQAGIQSILDGKTCYTSNKGLKELRCALVDYISKKNGIHYDAEDEILITNGASEGLDLVFRAISNLGDEVIVPEPSYVCYSPLLSLCGINVKRIDTTQSNFIPDPHTIEAAITSKTKALVLCSPNNPTGVSIPSETLKALASLAKKHDLWIISDEIYAELNYDKNFESISRYAGKEHCVILNGFSKAFAMTGWRLGFIAGPEDILSRCLKIHQYSALCANTASQFAALEALKEPFNTVKKMKAAYKERRDYIIKCMQELGFSMPYPDGAFYCFVNVEKSGLNGEAFASALLEAENVAVVPGIGFGLGGENYIRICYAYPLESIKKAMLKIKNFIMQLQK